MRTTALLATVHYINTLTEDQIKELSAGVDVEALKESPFFKDATVLSDTLAEANYMQVGTHKELKAIKVDKI